jgi:hypothetical protein
LRHRGVLLGENVDIRVGVLLGVAFMLIILEDVLDDDRLGLTGRHN